MSDLGIIPNYRATRPARSFMMTLLHTHIWHLDPKKSLDAGCGELRTRSYFKGDYVGITNNPEDHRIGVKLPENKGLPSTIYLTDLHDDFSWMGSFDLALCTGTLRYIPDGVGLMKRLADRVCEGGALIFEDFIEKLPAYQKALEPLFSSWNVTYWGFPDGMEVSPPSPAYNALFEREMRAADRLTTQTRFYVLATGKLSPAGPQKEHPPIREELGLYIITGGNK